jgi:hypothetical protein
MKFSLQLPDSKLCGNFTIKITGNYSLLPLYNIHDILEIREAIRKWPFMGQQITKPEEAA